MPTPAYNDHCVPHSHTHTIMRHRVQADMPVTRFFCLFLWGFFCFFNYQLYTTVTLIPRKEQIHWQ